MYLYLSYSFAIVSIFSSFKVPELTCFSIKNGLIIKKDDDIKNNYEDKFLRTNQFLLNDDELKELSEKIDIDIWLLQEQDLWTVKMNNYFIKDYLSKWPHIFYFKLDEKKYAFLIKDDIFFEDYIYRLNPEKFEEEWHPSNNCTFLLEDGQLKIVSTGDDPYFENTMPFNITHDKTYFIKIRFTSTEESYIQLFFKNQDDSYSEKNTVRFLTQKGENTVITELKGNFIRIDPGLSKSEYMIEDMNVYFLELN